MNPVKDPGFTSSYFGTACLNSTPESGPWEVRTMSAAASIMCCAQGLLYRGRVLLSKHVNAPAEVSDLAAGESLERGSQVFLLNFYTKDPQGTFSA